MSRGLDKKFLNAMREKLAHGRQQGYVGWDRHWEKCTFDYHPKGPYGMLMDRLHQEVSELVIALHEKNAEKIKYEAADVANFAMFIADIHGGLDEP